MLANACPKPTPTEKKPRRWFPRATKPLKRAWLKRGTKKIPERNERRIARRHKEYSAVIRSAFHKQLRYLAYQRSGGLCECVDCVGLRKPKRPSGSPRIMTAQEHARFDQAWTAIPVWFTKKGADPAQRFRSTDGELHHLNYKYFSEDNPEELQHVRWVWKECHKRIEAKHSTRRRFLSGKSR